MFFVRDWAFIDMPVELRSHACPLLPRGQAWDSGEARSGCVTACCGLLNAACPAGDI